MPRKTFSHEGIKGELRGQIERGEYSEGARVPSEYELARHYGVSRNRTRQALRELELEGYLVRRRGSGSYVASRTNRCDDRIARGDTTVALVFPQYLSEYSRDVVDGFMHHIAVAGGQAIVYNVQFEEEREARSLKAIADSGVTGLAVWVEHNIPSNVALMNELQSKKFPVVLLDRALPGALVDSVTSDNVAIGYRLTKALTERGHRRIAFAGMARSGAASVNDRFSGYCQALKEAGIGLDNRCVTQLERVYQEPSVVAGELMGLYERPTAVFCVHDTPARLLYDELVKFGYPIPDAVELAALEDNHFPPSAPLPLIRVFQQGFEIGYVSAGCLLARMSNPDIPYRSQAILPTEVVVDYKREQSKTGSSDGLRWPVARRVTTLSAEPASVRDTKKGG